MTATTIVIMIFSLIGLLIAANGIEQYKQKLDYERHQQLLKYAAIILENEELLLNAVQLPMSNRLTAVILNRNISVMEQSLSLMPNSLMMPKRLSETRSHLSSLNLTDKSRPPLKIPNTDEHNAALIRTIKKMRHILNKQKHSGKLSHQHFVEEDEALGFTMLKLFVEYKIKQGNIALKDGKNGTARQFYEKALKTLFSREKEGSDAYTQDKVVQIREKLDAIAQELKLIDERDIVREDNDESLQMLFGQSKKKW